ncbi:PREDICTED: uncharacterized protein LOC109235948 [Nicotiana attenuata]|uniref:uncharacterized protein LOC109235948 n=1 Tax=Nicotiana attenuata TaxID=49451 RepID=UPI00090566D1|nr:PREDICTED: uncharacterized protein LOC109235948 [Nicotiana attenuata]
MKTCYWQVRIAEEDEHKMTCVKRFGSYNFLVMPLGLTNAPATFCTLMNQVFREYIDEFVVLYLDDIVEEICGRIIIFVAELQLLRPHILTVDRILKRLHTWYSASSLNLSNFVSAARKMHNLVCGPRFYKTPQRL